MDKHVSIATVPMQTDIWMFRAQTMKMAGGSFDPMHWNRPFADLPAKLDGLWESIQPHVLTLFGAATCPVQNDVMNVYRHLDVLSPNNEDDSGSFDPMHQNRPWRDAPLQKSDGLWESKQYHAWTCLGQWHGQCRMMWWTWHLDVLSPNNEDDRGSFDPMHQNRPWGDATAKSDCLWESKQPHAGTLLWVVPRPVQKDVTVVEAGVCTGESATTTGWWWEPIPGRVGSRLWGKLRRLKARNTMVS